MKRMHVNVTVSDLNTSVQFYNSLFDAQPAVLKPDYAKWMLEDPRVNFSIATGCGEKGIDHLGIQVESDEELGEVHARLNTAGGPLVEQGETTCCYAHSAKNWTFDPEGIAWETFLTRGESSIYGEDRNAVSRTSACCA